MRRCAESFATKESLVYVQYINGAVFRLLNADIGDKGLEQEGKDPQYCQLRH